MDFASCVAALRAAEGLRDDPLQTCAVLAGRRRLGEEGFASFETARDWASLAGALLCVCLAALAAGLAAFLL